MPYSRKRSLAERKRRWQLLIANRQRILEETPHLTADLDALAEVNEEVAKLVARQALYVSKARQITTTLRSMAKKGDSLRGRIGSGIRWKHGFDSAVLIEFGFKPRRTKRHQEEEPGEVAPIPGEEEAGGAEETAGAGEEGTS